MLIYSLYKARPYGVAREMVLLEKQRKLILIKPELIACRHQVVPARHDISLQRDIFISKSRVEGTESLRSNDMPREGQLASQCGRTLEI